MIYLDHAATTPLDSAVLNAMLPYLQEDFGNASSLYRLGQNARQTLDESRMIIAKHLECSLDEILFTSGATESNNLFLQGVIQHHFKKNPQKIPHVITSAVEHSSVLEVLRYFQKINHITLTIVPVDANGLVSVEEIKSQLTPETVLVSLQAVNNEIGAVQPIARVGRICQKNNIVFHIDAVQAVGYVPVSCEAWKCDALTLSAHKIYGPKGIGLLFVKSGTEFSPLFLGGGQERGYRSGTENVAGIVGMTTAIDIAITNKEKTYQHLLGLQQFGIDYFKEHLPEAILNGPEIGENRSVANINFSFPFDVSGESLVQRLDLAGIAVSLGSACSSGLMKPSYVLQAIGRSENQAKSSLRITLGRTSTLEELEKALPIIVETIQLMRSFSHKK